MFINRKIKGALQNNICDSTHQNGLRSDFQNWLFALSQMTVLSVLSAQFLVQKMLKSDSAISRYGNFIDGIIKYHWKVDFKKTGLKVLESGKRYLRTSNFKSILTLKCFVVCFFTSNSSSKRRIVLMILSNFKIDLKIIFSDIFTLLPNSKSNFPTIGTFLYVESHIHTYKMLPPFSGNFNTNKLKSTNSNSNLLDNMLLIKWTYCLHTQLESFLV